MRHADRIKAENEIALADAMERFESVKLKRLSDPKLCRVCPVCRIYFVAENDKLCFECKKL